MRRKGIPWAVFALSFMSLAHADTFFISVDEWGKGYVCNGDGSSVAIPLCFVNPANGLASFARLASGFTNDPTPGGGTHVLTYNLPFDNGVFDVVMADPAGAGLGDLLRFRGTQLLFYSLQELTGTGDCSTMNPPATGCDGLADVKNLPPPLVGNTITIPEVGPEGDNSGLFFAGGPASLQEFIFQSDELTVCPSIVPNCTPFNIAPPLSNPLRDITGFVPLPGFVFLPVGNGFNPLDVVKTPEPGSVGLVLLGCIALANRYRRRYPHSSDTD